MNKSPIHLPKAFNFPMKVRIVKIMWMRVLIKIYCIISYPKLQSLLQALRIVLFLRIVLLRILNVVLILASRIRWLKIINNHRMIVNKMLLFLPTKLRICIIQNSQIIHHNTKIPLVLMTAQTKAITPMLNQIIRC